MNDSYSMEGSKSKTPILVNLSGSLMHLCLGGLMFFLRQNEYCG